MNNDFDTTPVENSVLGTDLVPEYGSNAIVPLSSNSFTPTAIGDILRYEAEELTLNNNDYQIEFNNASSGSKHISLVGSNSTVGIATGVFNGEAGSYQVKVGYYDENDGVSPATVTVAGDAQSFSFSQNLPGSGAVAQTLTSRITHSELALQPGDTFEIEGEFNLGEFARFDYIEFLRIEPTIFRYEVEDLQLSSSYQVESNNASSGGENISLGANNSGVATGVFDGTTGSYQVKVGYYDENDGVTPATVTVAGLSSSFLFDDNLPDGGPTSATLTERITHPVINLQQGDTFKIEATSNFGEYARFDYIKFFQVDNPLQPDGSLLYEAEALQLDGYQPESTNSTASGGQQISLLNTGSNTGSATGIFIGDAGSYRVEVGYYDENDGEALAEVTVAGQSRSFVFDDDLGANIAIPEALTSRITHSVIGLQPGDVFEIEGQSDDGEPARIDYIRFIPVQATLQPQSTVRYEAEALQLSTYQVESNNNSSGGEHIAVNNNSGTATGTFDGETGIYQVKLGYYDENDGVSSATITVGGQSRGFQFDEDLPDGGPTSVTLTERVSHLAVKLKKGDTFEIEATSNFGEYARFDYIDFTPINPPAGSNYYVSPSGSDNNPGTQSQPWKTINYAVSQGSPVTAGDTILVQPGVYTETVTLDKSGYEELGHITLKANGNVILRDPDPIPDPITGDFKEGVIQSAGDGYWIIDGFRIENTSWAGISLRDANNMIVQNNHTFETGAPGIIVMPDTFFAGGEGEVTSKDIKVLGNTVERANWKWTGSGSDIGTQEALSIWGVDGFEVANNLVKEGTREGIDVKTGSRNGSVHNNTVTGVAQVSGTPQGYNGGPAIYIEGNRADTFNIDVYNNVVYGNTAEGIAVVDEVPAQGDVKDVRVYNNLVYGNGLLGVNGGVGITVTSNVSDVEIFHNTVVNNIQSILIDGTDAFGGYKPNNVLVRNNIFADAIFRNGLIEDADNVVLDNNLFTDGFTQLYESGGGLNNLTETNNTEVGSIGFLDAAGNDYRLSANSAAIDIGSDMIPDYLSIDKDGKNRDRDNAPDVGAYEYHV